MQATFPSFNWERFWEINTALNWELWHGPLPDDYWSYVEPLEHYTWAGFEKAAHDLNDMLGDLPGTLWVDADFGECVTDTNPEDDEENWVYDDDPDQEPYWAGGEWARFEPRDLLHKEVRSYI